jgi:hypothetical protein
MCARCRLLVQICPRCDRGNIYCGAQCATIRRRESIERARERYERTPRARRLHAARQQRYRERKRAALQEVTDQGPPPVATSATLAADADEAPAETPTPTRPVVRCDFCGRACAPFARRNFVRKRRRDRLLVGSKRPPPRRKPPARAGPRRLRP